MTPQPRGGPCGTTGMVVFDNDGVLVDSEGLANVILADLLTHAGLPTTVEESVATYQGGSVGRVRELAERRLGRSLPSDFEATYNRRLFASFERSLSSVPGVADVVDRILAEGIPVCVASSGPHDRIRLALRLTGLLDRFDGHLFSADDVARGKPAPDLLRHAATVMGADPARCLVVEDSTLGVEAGKAAGMYVVGFAATTPPDRLAAADLIVRSMAELLDALPALLPLVR